MDHDGLCVFNNPLDIGGKIGFIISGPNDLIGLDGDVDGVVLAYNGFSLLKRSISVEQSDSGGSLDSFGYSSKRRWKWLARGCINSQGVLFESGKTKSFAESVLEEYFSLDSGGFGKKNKVIEEFEGIDHA